LDNKNIKHEIIEKIFDIESNWYSAFKEFLIFSGVTFTLYCNYYLTTVLSSMIYFHYSAQSKIQDEMGSQIFAIKRYNLTHRDRLTKTEFTLPIEDQMLQSDMKYNIYNLITYFLITPLILGIIYLVLIQMNLRSKIRIVSVLFSFLIVSSILVSKEFNSLINDGEGVLFIFNSVIPFIVSFFLCLFVLLTPKNGKFSYYN
jgi:hypothetical protein